MHRPCKFIVNFNSKAGGIVDQVLSIHSFIQVNLKAERERVMIHDSLYDMTELSGVATYQTGLTGSFPPLEHYSAL